MGFDGLDFKTPRRVEKVPTNFTDLIVKDLPDWKDHSHF
jgi:hypothetical protein